MALFGKKKSAADETTAPVAAVAAESDPLGMDALSAEASADPLAGAAPVGKKGRLPKAPKEKAGRTKVKNGTMVGLNIGNAFIKAVEVSAKNGEISVSRMAMVPTPAEAYQNGNVLSNSALASALKSLWKEGGFKSRAVITSVAGTGALVVRVIEVPAMSDAQLADTMRLEAERYIPFPPSEVQMDFVALRDLPSDPDAGTMEVLLAAAQSEVVDLHVKAVQSAKLEPKAIDVEPIALGRTVGLQNGAFDAQMVDYNSVTALVNMGALSTEISLLRGDILVFTRTVSSGGNTLTQAISETLGISFTDAERLKIERASALPPLGYGTAQADDDFGLGDFGSDDFSNFGLEDSPAPSSSPSSAPASASADPFDLDFFNQGPKQSDAGAGHAQQEDANKTIFNFGESDDSTNSSSGQPAQPSLASDDLDFAFDDTILPAPQGAAPGAGAQNPPLASPNPARTPPASFDFDEIAPASGSTFDAGLLPSVTSDTKNTAASSDDEFFSMPSAFDFSDFDLPSTAKAGANPTKNLETPLVPPPPDLPVVSATPLPEPELEIPVIEPAPASAGGFNFGFSDEEIAPALTPVDPLPTAESGLALSLEKEEAPADMELSIEAFDTPPAPLSAAHDEENFDLENIFGAPQSGTPSLSKEPVGVASDDLEFGDLGLGDLNLGEPIAGGLLDDSGGDFASFGAGLSHDTSNTDENALYSAIEPSLAEIANEISRSLSFYLERMPDVALSQVWLTGGGARLNHFADYLTQNLGVTTAIYNPIAGLPNSSANSSPEFLAAVGPMYSTALGLAVRDFVD